MADHEPGFAPEHKPVPGKTRPSSDALVFARPPAAFDLGEQVVGSDHWYDITPIRSVTGVEVEGILHSWCEPLGDSTTTTKIASELGMTERAVAAATMEITGEARRDVDSTKANAPLRVRYKPAHAGETFAMFHYVIQTHDGGVSRGSVMIRARARALETAPTRTPDGGTPSTPSTQVVEPPVVDSIHAKPRSANLASAISRTKTAAGAIAKRQKSGVDLAKGEVDTYKRRSPGSSWWLTAAEIAVSAGIAGVAGIVAKNVASRAAKMLGMSEEIKKHSPLILGIGDGFKEGFKATAKAARSGNSGKPAEGTPTTTENDNVKVLSSDPVIDFWHRQGILLDQAEVQNETLIDDIGDRLLPLERENPAAAIATMERVRDGLEPDEFTIIHYQARQSVAQWLSAIAQSAHGSELLATRDGDRRATDMANVRDRLAPLRIEPKESVRDTFMELDREATRRTNLDGVLQLEVELPKGAHNISENLVITAAKLNGVAQSVANRLAGQPVRDLAIPVRIEVKGGARATITRDEVGRVRVHGRLPRGHSAMPGTKNSDEVQNIRAAMQLVDIVLAKELPSWWGEDPIQTDHDDNRGG